jgi:Trypsin-co-occurring domain 1
VAEVVRFEVGDGSSVLVETEGDTFGVERVSRGADGIVEAGRRLEDALASVRDAARASLSVLRELSPDVVEVEFGIKLAGEVGALIAKASSEGHFRVKLSWSPETGSTAG